jgi:hypothetical protein
MVIPKFLLKTSLPLGLISFYFNYVVHDQRIWRSHKIEFSIQHLKREENEIFISVNFAFQNTGKFTEDVASFRFFAITLSTINLAFAKPLTANNVENYFKALARVSSKFIVTRTFQK